MQPIPEKYSFSYFSTKKPAPVQYTLHLQPLINSKYDYPFYEFVMKENSTEFSQATILDAASFLKQLITEQQIVLVGYSELKGTPFQDECEKELQGYLEDFFYVDREHEVSLQLHLDNEMKRSRFEIYCDKKNINLDLTDKRDIQQLFLLLGHIENNNPFSFIGSETFKSRVRLFLYAASLDIAIRHILFSLRLDKKSKKVTLLHQTKIYFTFDLTAPKKELEQSLYNCYEMIERDFELDLLMNRSNFFMRKFFVKTLHVHISDPNIESKLFSIFDQIASFSKNVEINKAEDLFYFLYNDKIYFETNPTNQTNQKVLSIYLEDKIHSMLLMKNNYKELAYVEFSPVLL